MNKKLYKALLLVLTAALSCGSFSAFAQDTAENPEIEVIKNENFENANTETVNRNSEIPEEGFNGNFTEATQPEITIKQDDLAFEIDEVGKYTNVEIAYVVAVDGFWNNPFYVANEKIRENSSYHLDMNKITEKIPEGYRLWKVDYETLIEADDFIKNDGLTINFGQWNTSYANAQSGYHNFVTVLLTENKPIQESNKESSTESESKNKNSALDKNPNESSSEKSNEVSSENNSTEPKSSENKTSASEKSSSNEISSAKNSDAKISNESSTNKTKSSKKELSSQKSENSSAENSNSEDSKPLKVSYSNRSTPGSVNSTVAKPATNQPSLPSTGESDSAKWTSLIAITTSIVIFAPLIWDYFDKESETQDR